MRPRFTVGNRIGDTELSGAERRIVQCIVDGCDRGTAIAERLSLDERRVRILLDHLLHKLQLASVAALAATVRKPPASRTD